MKASLLLLTLATPATSLVPDHHGCHARSTRLSPSSSTTSTSIPSSTTQVQVAAALEVPISVQRETCRTKFDEKATRATEEHRWLNWVYKQWSVCPKGELSEDVWKNMVPAISKWSRRTERDAPDRGEELLERMIQETVAGNPHAELTVTMFNAAMNGFAKRGDPTGVQRILRRMETLRSTHPHRLSHLKPDVFSMSTLATAWAKSRSPEAADRAQSILHYMEVKNVSPNRITYNAVLNALASGSQVDKAIRAEDIVHRMKEQSMEGDDCQPDIYSYQSLIQAWAKTPLPGSPQKAERILRYMDEQSEKGNMGLSPNVYCFTSKSIWVPCFFFLRDALSNLVPLNHVLLATIHAWAKSTEKNRAKCAYELLQHMTKRYLENYSTRVKPNVVAFTAVLNACSYPMDDSERQESFHIAQRTMDELSCGVYDKPNFLSYAAFLAVCASCLDEGEACDDIVETVFEECTRRGQVGQIVLRKLQEAASPELFDRLVGQYEQVDGSFHLPRKWARRIVGERNSPPVLPGISLRRNVDSLADATVKSRLKVVQSYGGQCGIYSSGTAPQRLESKGISFSIRPMGS